MSEYPCEKHEEQIITLSEKVKELNKGLKYVNERDRIDAIERTQLKTLVDFIIDDGKQRAVRDQQITEAINNLNENIIILNHDMKDVKLDIQKINSQMYEEKEANILDIRKIQKDNIVSKLKKGVIISGCAIGGTVTFGSIAYAMIELIKKIVEG